MKKVIRLTERDLTRIVRRVINETQQGLFGGRLTKTSEDTPEIMSMFNKGEVSGTWHYDDSRKHLCIEAKTRRSWCYSDSNPDLSDFDSKKFKSGEKGNFTIESKDGGKTATLKIK
jgi:hypothetical protein